jgi:streptomycin 6-kinase
MHDEPVDTWLKDVPRRVQRCVEAWSLELDAIAPSSAGFVIHGRLPDGDYVTLKLVPNSRDFESQRRALTAFDGAATVRLLADAAADGALLLERALPGYALSALVTSDQDEAATEAAAQVIARMRSAQLCGEQRLELEHIGVEAGQSLHRYRRRYDPGALGPIPGSQIAYASSLIGELRESEDESVVLHGDFHHDNLLRADREPWLAIDPKGRSGEPAAELATFIRNPIDHLVRVPNLRAFLHARIDQLVERFGYDRTRVIGWAIGLAIVAACWQVEDREPECERWLAVADALM